MRRVWLILIGLVLGCAGMWAQTEVDNVSAKECASYGRELFDVGLYREAYPYVQKAAEAGYGDAHYMAGMMYELGLGGVARNYEIAMREYQSGAIEEHGECYLRMGVMYENGKGFAVNYKTAFSCYMKSTMKHHNQRALAYREVGRCYHCGIGVEINLDKAIEFYDKAINASNDSSFKNEVEGLKQRASSEQQK